MYKHANNKTMTSGAIAAMLSTILYGRRFFPYYVYNIIGGLDEEGNLFSWLFHFGTLFFFTFTAGSNAECKGQSNPFSTLWQLMLFFVSHFKVEVQCTVLIQLDPTRGTLTKPVAQQAQCCSPCLTIR